MKYISDTVNRLSKEKDGMDKNAALWQNQPITSAAAGAAIDGLNAKQKALDEKNLELATLQKEAHALSADGEDLADRIEALAVGLEGNNPDRLMLYGIKLRKPVVRKSAPSAMPLASLADDTDGVGFIVSTQADPDADMYEWQKGNGSDPARTDIIPEMKLFKTTVKLSFVDDDVPKGVRVFYKVRAVNAAGVGPWSEPVSRVQ